MPLILCTGGAGYIGSHTVISLINNQYDVLILDNFSNSNKKILERIESITQKKINHVQVDILDTQALDKVFQDYPIDGVIHFAAKKAVGESVAEPLLYYENNVIGLINLLKTMEKHNCFNIVFSSSATVYAPNERLITEDSPLHPSNPYGQTKFMGETILIDLVNSKKNPWHVSLLRYFNPIGNNATGLIGESPVFPNNLLPFIQQVAVGRRPYLNIFGNDYETVDGTGVRDYLHVEDLADGHVAALNKLLGRVCVGHMGGLSEETSCSVEEEEKRVSNGGEKEGAYYDVYNLGNGRGVSVMGLLKEFEGVCGKEIPYRVVERRPGDLSTVVADPSKVNKELGWKTSRTIQDACASAWKWQSAHPNGFNE